MAAIYDDVNMSDEHRKVIPLAQSNYYQSSPMPTATNQEQHLRDANAAYQQSMGAAYEKAYQNSLADLKREEAKIAPQYQASRNLTAGTSEQEKRAFAEYAATRGLNSGTGGQAELARGVTLQNNMANINRGEADAFADIATQRAKLANEYQFSIAQAKAQGNLQLAENLYAEYVRLDDAAQSNARYADEAGRSNFYAGKSLDQGDRTFNYNAGRDAVIDQQYAEKQQRDMALYMAESGDFSGLDALGIDTTQMRAVWQQDRDLAVQMAQKQLAAYGSSGSGTSGDKWDGLSYNEMMNAIESGMITPAVKSAWLHWMGEAYPEDVQPKTIPVVEDDGGKPKMPLVTNSNDNNGAVVEGIGYISWQELYRLVMNGTITETQDPKTGRLTYKRNPRVTGSVALSQ